MQQWVCNGEEYKSGDQVRVMRDVESNDPNGMGDGVAWDNVWVPEMDIYLGKVFEIDFIDDYGVTFVGGGNTSFALPLAALDKINVEETV